MSIDQQGLVPWRLPPTLSISGHSLPQSENHPPPPSGIFGKLGKGTFLAVVDVVVSDMVACLTTSATIGSVQHVGWLCAKNLPKPAWLAFQ
jgi:hypothetical protein